MCKTSWAMLCAAGLVLSACGASFADRTLSGAGVGAVGAAVVGANPVTGAVVGGAVGAVTKATDINLGDPIW